MTGWQAVHLILFEESDRVWSPTIGYKGRPQFPRRSERAHAPPAPPAAARPKPQVDGANVGGIERGAALGLPRSRTLRPLTS
eukprot:scaffold1275_cov401-Prasinococcus_capsulatus_cf.AAC.4